MNYLDKLFLCEKPSCKKLLIRYYSVGKDSEYEITEMPNILQFSTFTKTFEDLADYFQNAKFRTELVFDSKKMLPSSEQSELEKIVKKRNKFLEIHPIKNKHLKVEYAHID